MSIKENDSILDIFKQAKAGTRNIALAIDGGGIRGVMVAKALAILEDELRRPDPDNSQPILLPNETLNKYVRIIAGTSTGAIIASTIAAGIPADEVHELYLEFASDIFTFLRRNFTTKLANLVLGKPFYQNKCLSDTLNKNLSAWFFKGIKKEVIDKYASLDSETKQPVLLMEHLWNPEFRKPEIDLIITTMDLKTFKSRFVKPYNTPETANDCDFTKWPVHKAVVASSAIPLFFPMVSCKEKNCNSDFADGGVGAFGNPSYLAAYEISKVLNHAIAKKSGGIRHTSLPLPGEQQRLLSSV